MSGGREPDSPPLVVPQRRRVDGQIKQLGVRWELVLQDGFDDVRSQHRQVDHAADVAVADADLLGNVRQRGRLPRFQPRQGFALASV